MKRRKPVKKKTSARKMKQEIDLLVKAEVLERDGNKCVRCGKTQGLAASHVYPKGKYQRMRFLAVNLLTLCTGCHIYWWHKHPIEAAEWFLKTYPDRYEQLQLLKDTAPKVDLKDLRAELALAATESQK